MRAAALSGYHKRRKGKTTVRVQGVRVASDLVERDFNPKEPNRLWCADIKEIATWEGKLYLASVLDCFSRRVVGWAMRETMEAELVVDALEMAVARRQPEPGLVHHSDQGAQYVALILGQRLRETGIAQSMGSKGDCFDNAAIESYHATIEKDLLRRVSFRARREARTALFDYIESFYNRRRLHSTLGYRSPADYENSTPGDLELLSPLRDSHPPTTSSSLHQLPTPPKTPVSTKPGEDQQRARVGPGHRTLGRGTHNLLASPSAPPRPPLRPPRRHPRSVPHTRLRARLPPTTPTTPLILLGALRVVRSADP